MQFHLVRLTTAAEVVDRIPLPNVHDSVWMDDGRVLVVSTEDGVLALDPSTGSTRLLIEPT
ncbi:hypothetical protein SAMN03159343_0517 [Klenkia marina]|uniref:Uncharacterized protein n=1 Tax=Klenkia marina TaxID=1960309 RepID=A0A1G4XC97_9ACTN|nr:hypothetical protein [Klenkia marina]SCX38839.1 hypothetical protein SAMN03159343_0517 [Klenkia marina]